MSERRGVNFQAFVEVKKTFLLLYRSSQIAFCFPRSRTGWRKWNSFPEENIFFLSITCTLKIFSCYAFSSRLRLVVEVKTRRDWRFCPAPFQPGLPVILPTICSGWCLLLCPRSSSHPRTYPDPCTKVKKPSCLLAAPITCSHTLMLTLLGLQLFLRRWLAGAF